MARRRKSTRKRSSRRSRRGMTSMRGARGAGSMLVRIGSGALALSGVRAFTPNIAGNYQGALDKVLTGLIFKVVKRGPAKTLMEAGAIEGLSTAMDTYILPQVTSLVGGLGAPAAKANGGAATNSYASTMAAMQR